MAGRWQHAPSVVGQKNDASPGGQALRTLPTQNIFFQNPALRGGKEKRL